MENCVAIGEIVCSAKVTSPNAVSQKFSTMLYYLQSAFSDTPLPLIRLVQFFYFVVLSTYLHSYCVVFYSSSSRYHDNRHGRYDNRDRRYEDGRYGYQRR